METIACKTYLPDHVKNTPDDIPAPDLWAIITPDGYVQRLITAFRQYQVARWRPDLRTEPLLGALCESCLYAGLDDYCSGHTELDLQVASFWDSATQPTRILKVQVGLFDQEARRALLFGALWAVQKSGDWFWEAGDPAHLAFLGNTLT